MKRKVEFLITVGSHFPKPYFDWQATYPIGGEHEQKTVEFETDNSDPFKDACAALKNEMRDEIYHIWYWTWIKDEKTS